MWSLSHCCMGAWLAIAVLLRFALRSGGYVSMAAVLAVCNAKVSSYPSYMSSCEDLKYAIPS